jgi:hypothetical protein
MVALVGKHCRPTQGKEGGIQVLAGLAPSSQTVGSNKRVQGGWGATLVAPYHLATLPQYNASKFYNTQGNASKCH